MARKQQQQQPAVSRSPLAEVQVCSQLLACVVLTHMMSTNAQWQCMLASVSALCLTAVRHAVLCCVMLCVCPAAASG